ncbi:helix-turn-helix domain-containing protein [Caulobacter sp. SLTY]|uniref:helix-turn-helix domain-containing protein n=1 Tax=Caulobacter sp. SLTY TaxID=2683262 RepID=UPI001412B89C|nr:helix-turn-helix domain-containing protein [Caulobacter sp. SLTY]NBB17025.1 helix-turn-helix domain-containing protein [Caulobacter sp. SLTY]
MSAARKSPAGPPREGAWATAAEVLDAEALDLLSRDFGGRRIYIPRALGEDHPLVVSIGLDAARLLVEALAGEELEPPLTGGKRLRILEALDRGEKPEQIARALGVSRSWIFKLKKRRDDAAKEAEQPTLF